MALKNVSAGKNLPDEFNVIIEIQAHSEPVKYEVDKETGALFVDRFMTTAMHYPCNYGYIPETISDDGDPADVLVILPLPLVPGSVIRVRPVGVLEMQDEAGADEKILAVPVDKVFDGYANVRSIEHVSKNWRDRIGHFFTHYKDLEAGKWVKISGWGDAARARTIIEEAVKRFNAAPDKPHF